MERVAMNILVTGATGFLGSHLVPLLLEKDYCVVVLKRSFSDPWRLRDVLPKLKQYDIDRVDIESIFRNHKIDVIIHLATDYGKGDEEDVAGMIESNIILPTMLLDAGLKHRVGVFVNTDTFLPGRYSLYAATKKSFLEIAQFFTANREIKLINLTMGYLYGEKDNKSRFIPFAIDSILKERKIRATEGRQKRDFVYVKDAAWAYIKTLDRLTYLKGGFIQFNIGSARTMSLKSIVSKIQRIAGKKAKIQWGAISYRKNEIFVCKMNTANARRIIKWEPQTSLEEGLKNTISWYKKRE